MPYAFGAVLWVPRAALSSSGLSLLFFFCGGVLLCVLSGFARRGVVALPRGCRRRLVGFRPALVMCARCLVSAAGVRRWCLVLPGRRRGARRRFRLLCGRGVPLPVRGWFVLAGSAVVAVCFARRLRCRFRRCCRRLGAVAFRSRRCGRACLRSVGGFRVLACELLCCLLCPSALVGGFFFMRQKVS